jgi:L1 cell adhesion molecule like protein
MVYEGERARSSDNNLLGFFNLSCHPGAPRGHPLDVCFTINENGILNVSAMEISTGNMNEITITNEKERLSREEIKNLIQEAEEYRVEDEEFLRKAKVRNALDDCVYKLRKALKNTDLKSKLSSQKVRTINRAITVALKNYQQKEVGALEDHLKDLESMLADL